MTRDPIVLGVDPGLRETGLALVDGRTLLAAGTVTRDGPPVPIGRQLTGVDGLTYLDRLGSTLDGLEQLVVAPRRLLVAVEDVVNPSPHMGTTNPAGIIATAVALGYVIGWAEAIDGVELVTVRPARNGAGIAAQYPAQLLDRGGKVSPGGKRRHERSAYDVALAGLTLNRLRLRAAG